MRNISLSYGDHLALDDVSLTVEHGEVLAVLGPSGSGKSSLLRVIAGLERPSTGTVHISGEDITRAPVYQRNVGLMFQDYVLFPHLNVFENVSFGLRMARQTVEAVEIRTNEVLSWVDLNDFGSRQIDSLSGGEQQRVALARALAPTPAVMMLDEPVGALDRSLRARLVPELVGVLRSIDLPTIYVTHDQDEAFAIADRVAILSNGRIVQCDRPEDLWRAPASEFVARFLGFENIASVNVGDGIAMTPWGAIPTDLSTGRYRVIVRRNALRITLNGELAGEVRDITFVGGEHQITISCLNHDLVVHTRDLSPPIGTLVHVSVAKDALVVVSPESLDEPLYTTQNNGQ